MRLCNTMTQMKRQNCLVVVYSTSSHKMQATKILKKLYANVPQWRETIRVISVLPVLLWAKEKRESMPLSAYALYDENSSSLRSVREINEKMVEILSNAMREVPGPGGKALRAVHLMEEDVDNSVMRVYERAIVELCMEVAPSIQELYGDLLSIYSKKGQGNALLYDMEILVRLNRFGKKRHKENLGSDAFFFEKVAKTVATCPFFDEHTGYILAEYVTGKTETEIAQDVGHSRSYVRARLPQGEKVMALFFWGLRPR